MAPLSKLSWTRESQTEDLSIFRAGQNLKIVLTRPRNGNALSPNMVAQIISCFRNSASDDSVSRIVITGEGRFFCTGMALGDDSSAVGKGAQASNAAFDRFTELFEVIQACPKVTIAAINGPCYAGGIGLAFSCDIRLAVHGGSATLSEVKLGLCPAIISRYLLREWGVALTREAMLSGRSVPFTELRQVGSIHGLSEDFDSLQALVDTYLMNLCRCAPEASALCKRAVRAGGKAEQDQVLKDIFQKMMSSEESAIGMRNFKAKRPTNWDEVNLTKSKL